MKTLLVTLIVSILGANSLVMGQERLIQYQGPNTQAGGSTGHSSIVLPVTLIAGAVIYVSYRIFKAHKAKAMTFQPVSRRAF